MFRHQNRSSQGITLLFRLSESTAFVGDPNVQRRVWYILYAASPSSPHNGEQLPHPRSGHSSFGKRQEVHGRGATVAGVSAARCHRWS